MARLCDPRVEKFLQDMVSTDVPLERPLIEAKARLPHLDDSRERAEFLRDCVAMGNTVRRMRRRGYLIYGVTEQRTVVDQSQAVAYPDPTPSSLDKRMERNENSIAQCLQNYVTSTFDFELLSCEVQGPVRPEHLASANDQDVPGLNRGVVICLEFRFISVDPYAVKKDFDYSYTHEGKLKNGKLRKGAAWTRTGTSKGNELPPDQHHLLVGYQDAPYVDNRIWHSYATGHPRDEPSDFFLSVIGSAAGQNGDAFEMAASWLESAKNPVLYVHGGIGSGKSTLLSRLYTFLLDKVAIATENIDPDDITDAWIPVYVDLNGSCFADSGPVADHLLSRLNLYGALTPALDGAGSTLDWKRRLFECGDYKFLVLFDGVDELEDSQDHPWTRSVASIRQFIESNGGRIRSVIAGRSGTLSSALLHGWSQLVLLPLSDHQIETSSARLDNPRRLINTVKRNPDLSTVITSPLALQAVFACVQRIEQQTRNVVQADQKYDPGDLVDEVVSAVFRHESAKDPARNRDETRIRRMNALARLAWQLDGRAEMAALEDVENALGGEEIVRAKEMGILVLVSNAYYKFASPLLKAYFAARHAIHLIRKANSASNAVDWDAALRHATPVAGFWVPCEDMFTPMLAEDERESAKAFHRFVQETTLSVSSRK